MISIETKIETLLEQGLISNRTFNLCRNHEPRLSNVNDLINFRRRYNTFNNIKGVGKKSCNELMNIVNQFYVPDKFNDAYFMANPGVQNIIREVYEELVNSLDSRNEVKELIEIILPSEKHLYYYLKENPHYMFECDRYDVLYSEATISDYFVQILNMIEVLQDKFQTQITYQISGVKDMLEKLSTVREFYKYKMPQIYICSQLTEKQIEKLKNSYNSICEKANKGANMIRKSFFNSIFEIIPHIEMAEPEIYKIVGKKTRPVYDYYYQIHQPFKVIYELIAQA